MTDKHKTHAPLSLRARVIDWLRSAAPRGLASLSVGLLLAGLYLTSLYSYLLFHTLAEMFSIVVGGALFLLVWNARQRIDNQCLLFIGLSTFFVAALNLLHTLAYSGMPIFVGYDANLPTQLWIAARYLQSLSLLLAVLFIKRTVPIGRTLLAYSLITGVLVISIFARAFPVCYVTDVGLTDFKKISEYVIVGILIAASWGLWRARSRFDGKLVRLLLVANALTIGAELAFTSYISVYGPANLIGHLFKMGAFAVWYRAIVRAGILRPLDVLFRNLRDSDIHLRRAESVAHFGNWELNLAERKIRASAGASAIYGLHGEEWPLAEVQGLPLPEYRATLDAALADLIEHRQPYNVEFRIRRPSDGQLRDIHSIAEYDAAQRAVFGVIDDITDRVQAEAALRESEERYRNIFNNSIEGIFQTTPAGRYRTVNPAFAHMFGYASPEDMIAAVTNIGQQLYVHSEDRQRLIALLRASDGMVRNFEAQLIRRDGSLFWVSINACMIQNGEGQAPFIEGTCMDITERKQAEDELRTNRRQLTDIIEFLPDATAAIDREKRVIIWNKAIEDMTGVPAAEMIGQGDYAYTTPFYGEARPSLVDLVFADQAELATQYPTITRQGDTLLAEAFCNALYHGKGAWVTAKVSPLHDQFGNVIGAIESIRDITDRKRAEAALRESEEKYRFLAEGMKDVVWTLDPQTLRFLYVSPSVQLLRGFTPEEVIAEPIDAALTPEGAALVRDRLQQRTAEFETTNEIDRKFYTEEIEQPRKDGTTVWTEVITRYWQNEKTGRIEVHGVTRDITERKQVEQALRESEERLAHIIDFLPDATLVIDREGKVIAWNRAIEEMTGVSKNEIMGQTGFAHATPFYGKARPILIDLIFRDQNEIEKEYTFISRKGDQLTAEAFTPMLYQGQGAYLWGTAAPLYDSSGHVVGAIESIRDITESKQAEEALRESEEKYRRIVETANEGIVSLDSQARITFVNRQMTAMLGYPIEEMLGQKFESFLAEDQLSDHAAQMKNRALGQDAVYERCFRRKDGSQHWALVSASAILDADGQLAGSFGMLADITERKRAEAALRASHAELQTRNEELDVFAHMVAHDLKNPLGVMMGYAELLTETYDALPTETIQQTLNSISRSGRKADSIIESLFMFASVRKQDVQVAPLDMAHLVAEVLLRLADSIQDSGADIHVPDRAGWPVALGHAPWIEEIWVNYLSNALKYGGPQPRIELGAALLPPRSATARERGQSGGFIRFSVRDYGPGLTPEQQERLFAPFERLGQAQVKGHGLGLSVVRRIAEKLGGQVGVDSQPGQGSTFYFTLPAAPDQKP